jgi:hypothetical protein
MLFSSPASSQDDLIPPARARGAKRGFLGGLTPGWLFVDVKPVNTFLTAAGGAPLNDDGIFFLGGGGAVYVGVLDNVRLGGMGVGGTISSRSVDATGVLRDAEMNVGFGGITIEYVVPVVPRVDVAVGGMLGWGGVNLTLRRDTGGILTWGSEWESFGDGDYNDPGLGIRNITRELSGSYFIWVPSLNVEYGVLGWLGVRLGVSYVGMSAASWTVDDEYDLIGTPGDIDGKGVMINGGIFVGTF